MAGEKSSPDDRHSSRVIRVVFLALLLDLLGFTVILPLLPSILDHYSETGDNVYLSLQSIVDWFQGTVGVPLDRKYTNVLFGGLIGSVYSLLQFIFSPVMGAASDQHGRRPLLLLTTAGLIFSYILWAVSHNFSVFLLSRVVGGICKGNVSLCTAVVADLPCPKARNRGMAMIGVAFSLGFTLGPLMGAYFALRPVDAELFYQGPALLAVLFSVADLLFIFLMLPETLHKGTSEPTGVQEIGDLLNPVALFNFSAVTRTKEPPSVQRMHNLKVLGWVYFAYLFLFSGLEFTLSFLTHQRFQFSRYALLKHATGEDVFLHWYHHGNIPGRIRTQDPTRSADPDSPHGNIITHSSLHPHWNSMEFNSALHQPVFVFLCCCHCCAVSFSTSIWTRHSESEGYSDGDPA
ncbi:major facilitator superfamily domain-containing protein 10 isoform X2 [Ictalurus punctatus]|uniref:Major facilitator superfamily domain-containing protein 10 isoform X2 n=1 Tax=Ictalurus punctatus TaxID=7998 RepID=A0A9F7QZ39_ICTPU|nr:major facilitator superfamily domain-containing protein 10 isoform X2 [Ictalurus punctatus]